MHQSVRAQIRRLVDRGLALCTRCGETIAPGSLWDLDHRDDRRGYLGAAHASCNRAAGGAKHGARRQSRRW